MARTADYPIDSMFTERWSPRAMSGEPLSDTELSTLFEAARWAPSAGNSQPWRFVFARRDTPTFETFFNLLDDGNKAWCNRAAALVVLVSKNVNAEGKPLNTSKFDAGAAWVSLAFQARKMNLVAHGMAGFDYARAKEFIGADTHHDVMCMIAIGKHGSPDLLSEKDRKREQPNARKPITETTFEGKLPKDA